jgi:hypothetical protein
MPTIGAPLRKWTLFLLLCSIPTSALAQGANETATVESNATADSGATTQHTSTPASSPTSSPLPSPPRRYADTETTSPYRTINYITHTLPQQCAKTSWSAPGANGTGTEERGTSGLENSIPGTREGPESAGTEEASSVTPAVASQAEPTGAAPTPASSWRQTHHSTTRTSSPLRNGKRRT